MSGFVPKRVSMTRTAMGSTDANSSGMNGHSIVSSIGRRSTLLRNIKTRSFGSMWQIDYQNAVDTGAKCTMETLLPQKDYSEMTIPINTDVDVTLFRDGNTSGFVRKSLQHKLVTLYGGDVYTDTFCAFGDINNNVGDDIVLGPGTYGFSNSTAAVGRKIIGIERWLTTGWTDLPQFQQSLVVGFSKPGTLDLNPLTAPKLTINGVTYLNTGVVTPSSWGGVDVGPFNLVQYGKNGATTVGSHAVGTAQTLDLLFGPASYTNGGADDGKPGPIAVGKTHKVTLKFS